MWTLLIIFVVVLLGYLWSKRRFYLLAWKLKGPFGFPFLGNLEILKPEDFLRFTVFLNKNYQTPTTMWVGPLCFVYVDDPKNMERILKAPECNNKSVVYNIISEIIGDGLLSNGNPKWAVHRKLLNPVLNHRNLLSFFPIFNAEADILCKKLGNYADTNETTKILTMLQKFSISVACQTTMGKQMNLQDDSDSEIVSSYNSVMHAASKLIVNPIYALKFITKFYDPKFYENLQKSKNYIRKFVDKLVFDKLSQHDRSNNTIKQDDDNLIKSESIFIDYATNLTKKNLMSVDEAIDESNHFVVAAFETSAKTLHRLITFMALHTKWQEKLREEINEVFPGKECDVVYENLENLPLTEMIINETLRLLPVVPVLGRITDSDFQLCDDVVLPKGTNIVLGLYSMHRNPKYWGPDALEFNPDHFLPDAVRSRHPYVFAPFSKGPRNCIGWRYAYMNLKVAIVKVFKNFRFTTTNKIEDIELVFNVVSNLRREPVFKIHSIN